MSDALSSRDFAVGNFLSSSFRLFFRNFFVIMTLSLVPNIPILVFAPGFATGDLSQLDDSYYLVLLLTVPLSMICFSMIMVISVQNLRFGEASIYESFSHSIGRFLWLLILWVVVSVLIMVGFALLVVPGVFLCAVWAVCLPVCVVERLGPIASLRRSAALSKGARWGLFGGFVVLFVIQGVIAAPVLWGASSQFGLGFGYGVASTLVTSFNYALLMVAVAVAYHDLRVAKEGVDSDKVAEEFA